MKQMTMMGLDVGESRIGVALANTATRLPYSLTTLDNTASFKDSLSKLISEHKVDILVVGLPRNLSGDDTPQTLYSKHFAVSLKKHFGLPVFFQDEAGTSLKAKEELEHKKKPYSKKDIDALAATYILEDFLANEPNNLDKQQGDI